jgi:hypothetical protein
MHAFSPLMTTALSLLAVSVVFTYVNDLPN